LISSFFFFSDTKIDLLKKYPDLKWCMFNDGVYNVDGFVHPGGNFIIEEVIGTDANK
jgi:cytochrome b involved in lipid metabolism